VRSGRANRLDDIGAQRQVKEGASDETTEGRERLTAMEKSSLSERDICTKFITPALRESGWNEMLQIREEVSFTRGRIIVCDNLREKLFTPIPYTIRSSMPRLPHDGKGCLESSS
jgi:hypothetical protein